MVKLDKRSKYQHDDNINFNSARIKKTNQQLQEITRNNHILKKLNGQMR